MVATSILLYDLFALSISSLHPKKIKNQTKNTTTDHLDLIDKETIDELNSLIGELDLFQKEHELMERKLNEKLGYTTNDSNASITTTTTTSTTCSSNNSNHNYLNNHTNLLLLDNFARYTSDTSSDRNDKLSDLSDTQFLTINHNGCSTETSSLAGLSCMPSDDDQHAGFENPSFLHLNDTEIVVIRSNAFPNEIDEFNHNVPEVITLKHDSNTKLNEIEDNGVSTFQRFNSFRCPTPTLLQNISISSYSSTNDLSTASDGPVTKYSRTGSLVEGAKIKPAITPRPASLSGLC